MDGAALPGTAPGGTSGAAPGGTPGTAPATAPGGEPQAAPASPPTATSRRDLPVTLGVPVAAMAALGWRLLTHVTVPGAVDHPSQYARMEWFRTAMATGRDPLGFTFAFGGGYPDLQLYPPGVASLGWFFADVVHLGPTTGYWLVVVCAWFAPALAASLTLRWVGARTATAALGGVVVGVLSFGYSGTRGGAAIGVLGSRISLAASVLLFGLLVRWVRRFGRDRNRDAEGAWWRRATALVPIALAAFATGWFHGFFLPAAILTSGVLAVVWRRRRVVPVMLAVAAGLLAAGWWWIGAIATRDLAVPIERAPGQSALDFLLRPAFDTYGGVDWLIVAVVAALAVLRLRRAGGLTMDGSAVLLVPAGATAVAFVAAVVDTAVGSSQLDASRVVDGLYGWVSLLSVLVVETIPVPSTARGRYFEWRSIAVIACAAGALWFALQARGLPPVAFTETLADVEQRGPAQLWPILERGHGRVVFTFSSFEDESSIMSLTFARTGREPLIGGPLQAALQHGPGATKLVGHGNDFDNRSLFGIRWTAMRDDPAELARVHDWLVELRVTQVVSERREHAGLPVPPADVLGSAPALFRSAGTAGALEVWEVIGAVPDVVVEDRIRLLDGAGWYAYDPEASVGDVSELGLDRWRQPIVDLRRPERIEIAGGPSSGGWPYLVGGALVLLMACTWARPRSHWTSA